MLNKNFELISNKVASQKVEAIPTQVGKNVDSQIESALGEVSTVRASELFNVVSPYFANRGEETMDMSRVKKIAKSIIGEAEIPGVHNSTFWLVEPIIVDQKNVIVDGHYTAAALLEVYRKTGYDLPVYVIKRKFPRELKTVDVVSKFNTCKVQWRNEDFVGCYLMEGYPEYIKLRDAAMKLGKPFVKVNKNGEITTPNYKYVCALMTDNSYPTLRKGDFKFDESIVERGHRVQELLKKIFNGEDYKVSNWVEQFVKSYTRQDSSNKNSFKVFMKYADRFVMDGSTSMATWDKQFQDIWDEALKNI